MLRNLLRQLGHATRVDVELLTSQILVYGMIAREHWLNERESSHQKAASQAAPEQNINNQTENSKFP